MHGRIEDLDVSIRLDIGSRDFARFFLVDSQCLRLAAVQLKRHLFEIENNVGGVFHDSLDR
jgi:hypothetical protein